MKASRLTRYALLTALALILSYLEAQVPAFFAVPGMKLGLTNLVVLFALYVLDEKGALVINLVRIVLSGLLFGSVLSLAYSLAGGFLSFIAMLLLKKTGKFSLVTVSVAGGIAHNLGQILTAMVLLETSSLLWYLPVLWFSGLAAGAVVGLLGAFTVKRLAKLGEGNT